MTERVVAFLENGVPGAAEDARLFASFWGQYAGTLATVQGVRNYGDLWVRATDPASMNVVVGAGQCLIDNPSQAIAPYIATNDAGVTVPIAAADVQFGRIDLIVFQVYDSEVNVDPNDPNADTGKIIAIQGTPGPSPTAPAVPDSALYLATVPVPRNATAISAVDMSERVYTSALGGIQTVLTVLPTTGNFEGRHVYRLSDSTMYVYRSGAWDLEVPVSMPRGRVAGGYNHSRAPGTGSIGNDDNHTTTIQEISFTAKSGRLYRVESYAPMVSSASSDWVVFGHYVNGVGPRHWQGEASLAGIGSAWNARVVTFLESPALSSGVVTVQLRAYRVSGSGTHYLAGDSRGSIFVDDWGDLSHAAS